MTVSLAGRDLIVNTAAVRSYILAEKKMLTGDEQGCKQRVGWSGKGLDVLWFDQLDHAQVFDSRKTRRILVDAIREFCQQDA